MTLRALNRTLLARQMLLARQPLPVVEAVHRLAALQTQQARLPFIGLWSRLAGFQAEHLRAAYRSGDVVRATWVRATLHTLTSADYRKLRWSIQPVLDAGAAAILKIRGAGIDHESVVAEAARLFGQGPRTFNDVRAVLLDRFPGTDERAMGYLARMVVPLVMAADDSEWSYPPDPKFTAASISKEDRSEEFVLRYLAAFGPATVADAQTWSGLKTLKPVFEKLRPRLTVERDERKRELFDIPDGVCADEDTPAPVRFLPGFDCGIMGHADRSRIISDEDRSKVSTKNLQVLPVFLVDGFVAGSWDMESKKKSISLTLTAFRALPGKVKRELEAEGETLGRFLAPEKTVEVSF